MRVALLIALSALSLAAANLKLYTADGDFQLVREYKVEGDTVRFFSVERAEWEEVPLSVIDLKRTQAESNAKKDAADVKAKAYDEEAAAAREQRAEIAKIPQDSGVYRIENGQLRTLKVADASVVTSKGRTALQILSPIPVFLGKATMEIPGETSAFAIHDDRPEFYFQMDSQQSLGIIKLKPGKKIRVVEQIEIMPITKEMGETRDSVPIFTKQLPGDNFYKIWPQDPLPKGEYAVVEYLESKVEMRVWDFRIE